MKRATVLGFLLLCTLVAAWQIAPLHSRLGDALRLSSGKLIPANAPGNPQRTNSLPAVLTISPDQRYIAILNNGWGTRESRFQQSIAIYEVATGKLRDFPDARLGRKANQDFFYGL